MFKMKKLILVVCTIFFISLNQETDAEILAMIGLASSVVSLYDFFVNPKSVDTNQILQEILNQNTNINKYFEDVMVNIEKLPSLINFLRRRKDLIYHFNALDEAYIEANDTKTHIDNKKFYTDMEYESRAGMEPLIKEHFNSIYNIWLSDDTSPFTRNFIAELQVNENVCRTGLSNLQLLDRLFINLRLATVKYYLTKLTIYDSLYIYKDKNYIDTYLQNILNGKENTLNFINKRYKEAAIKLKSAMAVSSQAYWTCDPLTYHNKDDDLPYIDIPIFRNGIIEKPTACDRLRDGEIDDEQVYMNKLPILADKDHVVIGAKFECMDRIISLKIKQAKLLPNGVINPATVSWKKNDYTNSRDRYYEIQNIRKRIHENVRGVDLTEVRLPADQAITGLQFKRGDHGRVYLSVHSSKIDFRQGKFIGNTVITDAFQGEEELSVKGYELTTAGPKENVLDSNNNQFLNFNAIPSDDGTFVIPFVDTTEVVQSIMLSGIGLIHKGQKGYGGFLGLKLFTFNITPYVLEETGIKNVVSFCNKANILEFISNNHTTNVKYNSH